MKYSFRVKKTEDGRAMLNLGCGFKMHWSWTNLDFSLYSRLAHHKIFGKLLKQRGFLSEERYQRLLGIDPKIITWDLQKGIPFSDDVFDVVYHSHLIEHLDRELVLPFLMECHRVLKAGGIIRVVVPDLQFLVDHYNSSILRLEIGNEAALNDHQKAISDLFDQMVRRQLTPAEGQITFLLAIERLLRGDTAKVGILHRWMYDKYSLKALLSDAGFNDIREMDVFKSRIDGWQQFNLDNNDDGTIYKPGSIYIEAVK